MSSWTLILALHVAIAGGDMSLADAAEQRDAKAINRLLAAKSDPNAKQPDGMTALHWATYWDDVELAKKLLAERADVAVENRYGVTPLALACVNGNGELVELLLQAGADANASLRGGETALMTAARSGSSVAVRSLLQHGAKVDSKDHKGQSAIMWSAAEGHVEVVRILIGAGADFRESLPSGFSPYFFAVREGRRDVVRELLAAGIDVNETMQPQKASGKGAKKGMSGLVLAVENGHLELAIDLVKAGADPNDQRSGFTALHTLTWVRKPNRGDGDDGDPAPNGSGDLSSLDFVRQMVSLGADVNVRLKGGSSGRGQLSRAGMTPFMMAAMTDDVSLMRLLIELGADPNIPNADHATPLMAAAGLGTLAPSEEAGTEPEAIEAVSYLLELGADVNAVDDNGETAMHGAAYKNVPKVVTLLASRGASVSVWNRKNKYGWTPISIAEGFRPGNFKPSPETIRALHDVLRANGITPPPPSVRNKDGKYSE